MRKITPRLTLAFTLIISITFGYFIDYLMNDIRPRYLEVMEDSLNNTAHSMAEMVRVHPVNGTLDTKSIGNALNAARKRRFKAQIFDLQKSQIDIDLYITDKDGVVVFDSRPEPEVGADYSRWNDVYLTLRGMYGVRSTCSKPDDPATSAFYIAAPIYDSANQIVGVLTVVRSKRGLEPFLQKAQRKILHAGILAAILLTLLLFLVLIWITRPLARLTRYLKTYSISDSIHQPMPSLGSTEIADLGQTIDQMRLQLAGRDYIAAYIRALTHEIKSPLTSIGTAREVLHEHIDELKVEDKLKFLNNIEEGVHRIDTLIQHTLTLSALENKNAVPELQVVRIHDIVQKALDQFQSHARARQINLSLLDIQPANYQGEGTHNNNDQVLADPGLLEQALGNLIQNALDFTPAGGSIQLASTTTETSVRILVVDNGCGIPAYAMDQIFNRFYSLARPSTGQKSSGLGLPIIREIASLHQGDIQLYNRMDIDSQLLTSQLKPEQLEKLSSASGTLAILALPRRK